MSSFNRCQVNIKISTLPSIAKRGKALTVNLEFLWADHEEVVYFRERGRYRAKRYSSLSQAIAAIDNYLRLRGICAEQADGPPEQLWREKLGNTGLLDFEKTFWAVVVPPLEQPTREVFKISLNSGFVNMLTGKKQ